MELQECTAQNGDHAGRLAGLGTEKEQHREHNRKKYGLTRIIQTTERGWGHAHFIDGRKSPRERKQLAQTYTCEDYKRKLVGELALNWSTNNTDLYSEINIS